MKLKDLRDNLTEAKASKSEQASIRGHLQNVNRLVRRGLLPASDLPMLRTALNSMQNKGDIAKLPLQQRAILQKYNKAIENAALGSTTSIGAVSRNIHSSFEIEGDEFLGEAANMQDPPMMMVLKRKGIRIFPDGKRVALYVQEKLGLTFTIPYSASTGMENPMVGVTEDFEALFEVKEGETKEVQGVMIDHKTAANLVRLHSELNPENQQLMRDHIKDPVKFSKIVDFANRAENAK